MLIRQKSVTITSSNKLRRFKEYENYAKPN